MILITIYLLEKKKVIDHLKKCIEWFYIMLLWD